MFLRDRIVKQKSFLRDEADLFPQRFLRERAQIASIDPNDAAGRIVKAQDEGKNGALARAARADEGVSFAGLDLEVEVLECVCHSAGVAESDVIELERPLRVRESRARRVASCTVGSESRMRKISIVA